MFEIIVLVASVVLMVKIADMENYSGITWGGLTAALCILCLFVIPVPFLRVIVGLVLSFTAVFRGGAKPVRAFLLLCVVVAGGLGAWSLDYPLLAVAQAGPAILALIGMFLRR